MHITLFLEYTNLNHWECHCFIVL